MPGNCVIKMFADLEQLPQETYTVRNRSVFTHFTVRDVPRFVVTDISSRSDLEKSCGTESTAWLWRMSVGENDLSDLA